MGSSSPIEYSPQRMRDALFRLGPFLQPPPDFSESTWKDVRDKHYRLSGVEEAEKAAADQNVWEFRMLLCEAATNLMISGEKEYKKLYKNIAGLISGTWLGESLDAGHYPYAELGLKFVYSSEFSSSASKLDQLKTKRGMPWEKLASKAHKLAIERNQIPLRILAKKVRDRCRNARMGKVMKTEGEESTPLAPIRKEEVIDLSDPVPQNENESSPPAARPKMQSEVVIELIESDDEDQGVASAPVTRSKPTPRPTRAPGFSHYHDGDAKMASVPPVARKMANDGFRGVKMPAVNGFGNHSKPTYDFGPIVDLQQLIRDPGFLKRFARASVSAKTWNSFDVSKRAPTIAPAKFRVAKSLPSVSSDLVTKSFSERNLDQIQGNREAPRSETPSAPHVHRPNSDMSRRHPQCADRNKRVLDHAPPFGDDRNRGHDHVPYGADSKRPRFEQSGHYDHNGHHRRPDFDRNYPPPNHHHQPRRW